MSTIEPRGHHLGPKLYVVEVFRYYTVEAQDPEEAYQKALEKYHQNAQGGPVEMHLEIVEEVDFSNHPKGD